MGTWALIQVVFNIFIALGLFVVIMRMNRAPKDDPRLSRGLQLLQSKIAVLEDLSDRTETQVGQLTAILEQKAREVQAKVQLAEQHVHAIKVSMERSLEVAKIFQDKIPHQEIIERQNTIKYVQAARLAHQGLTVEEILEQVDLPKGEIEFIAKVNRERLMFSEDQLPWWAKEGAAPAEEVEDGEAAGPFAKPPALERHDFIKSDDVDDPEKQSSRLRAEMELAERQRLVENLTRLQSEMQNLDQQLAKEASVRDLSSAFEAPQVPTASLQKLGEEFRKACEVVAGSSRAPHPVLPPLEQLAALIPQSLFISEKEDPPAPASESFVAAHPEPKIEPVPVERAKPEASPDLKAARAMAKEIAAPQPVRVINARKTSDPAPVIKKVEFPKISDREI